jgi:hypothetical protein
MTILAFLRTVVDDDGKATGNFECSVCGERFHPDKKHTGAVYAAFVGHRLQFHPIGENSAKRLR